MGTGEHANAVCAACGTRAEYETPHGRFCPEHALEEMEADDDLWMPAFLEQIAHPPRVG